LRGAGIAVVTGVLADAARRANLGHILRVTEGRPMVTLKLAETADGFAADVPGAPRLKITGAAADARVHMLRAMHDAVMIGVGTALADDPQLTVRLPGLEDRKPLRIVFDSHLKLSPSSHLAATAREHPTLVVTTEAAPRAAAEKLAGQGVEIVRIVADAAGHVDLAAALSMLAARGLTRIFCEGGPRLAAALMSHDMADDVVLFRSPKALGHAGLAALGAESRGMLNDPAHYHLAEQGFAGQDSYREYQRII
jgi:diaminohydroxyphosphoribosylaminopyrimidine deaminase / 5-amino-6-(5-phosphoribosylamino)uracil reductase